MVYVFIIIIYDKLLLQAFPKCVGVGTEPTGLGWTNIITGRRQNILGMIRHGFVV